MINGSIGYDGLALNFMATMPKVMKEMPVLAGREITISYNTVR